MHRNPVKNGRCQVKQKLTAVLDGPVTLLAQAMELAWDLGQTPVHSLVSAEVG